MKNILKSVLFIDSLKYNIGIGDEIVQNDTYYPVSIASQQALSIYQCHIVWFQSETVNSFIEKLKIKTNSSDEDVLLLRHSRAAASFDAVVSLALAFNDTVDMQQQMNFTCVLNTTLSNIKFSGLAVSRLS